MRDGKEYAIEKIEQHFFNGRYLKGVLWWFFGDHALSCVGSGGSWMIEYEGHEVAADTAKLLLGDSNECDEGCG